MLVVRDKGRGHLFCLNKIILLFVSVFLGYNQYWVWVYGFEGFFYVQKHPKAQRAVVLILMHTRRRGHSLN